MYMPPDPVKVIRGCAAFWHTSVVPEIVATGKARLFYNIIGKLLLRIFRGNITFSLKCLHYLLELIEI
jgi:hypothetical protein